MKLTIKLITIMALLLLTSPVIFLKGCGSALNGKSSGLCPDSVAPDGSTIIEPTELGAPSVAGGSCYSGLTFKVRDSKGNPMNEICVVVTTNAAIALTTTGGFGCNNAFVTPQSQIVTRTDGYGNVVIDMVTPATTAGQAFFVQVASGSLSVVATTMGAK